MKKAEIFFGCCLLVGILLKVLHLPGAGVAIGFSLNLLAMLYFPLGFFLFNEIPINKIFKKEEYSNISMLRKMGSIGAGVLLSIILLGIMDNLLHLPGAGAMLSIGLTFSPVLIIPVLIKLFSKASGAFYKAMLIRSLVIVGYASLLFLPSFFAKV